MPIQPLGIFIDSPIAPEIIWAWTLFARDTRLSWRLLAHAPMQGETGALLISENENASIRLDSRFRHSYQQSEYSSERVMPNQPCIYCEDGQPDFLSSIFYLVNCLQEYNHEARDHYDRFPYEASLQARFNCIDQNLVGDYINQLYVRLSASFTLPALEVAPSRLFLSHDIDLVNNAWKEDGKHALKNGRPDRFAGLLWRQFMGRPDWLNTDQLMTFDLMHGMPAVFFWIPRQSQQQEQPADADYSLNDGQIRNAMDRIEHAKEFELGYHASFHGEFLSEREQFPFPVAINRQHFLHFRLPSLFDRIEGAGFAADASLGFSERPGFRNSYALPFQPWSVAKRQAYNFIEIPLHLMDATFDYYWMPPGNGDSATTREKAAYARSCGLKFLTRNAKGGLISLLWHNNYWSTGANAPFKPILGQWLSECEQLGIRGISLKEILSVYGTAGPTHR